MDSIESNEDVSPMPKFYNQRVYSGERKDKIKKVPARSMSPQVAQPTVLYKKLFENSSIEATALSNWPLMPELKESYDRMLVYLEKLF